MISSSHFLNDGTAADPRLAMYLNLGTVFNRRSDSIWFSQAETAFEQRLPADGFEGIQLTTDEPAKANFPSSLLRLGSY